MYGSITKVNFYILSVLPFLSAPLFGVQAAGFGSSAKILELYLVSLLLLVGYIVLDLSLVGYIQKKGLLRDIEGSPPKIQDRKGEGIVSDLFYLSVIFTSFVVVVGSVSFLNRQTDNSILLLILFALGSHSASSRMRSFNQLGYHIIFRSLFYAAISLISLAIPVGTIVWPAVVIAAAVGFMSVTCISCKLVAEPSFFKSIIKFDREELTALIEKFYKIFLLSLAVAPALIVFLAFYGALPRPYLGVALSFLVIPYIKGAMTSLYERYSKKREPSEQERSNLLHLGQIYPTVFSLLIALFNLFN